MGPQDQINLVNKILSTDQTTERIHGIETDVALLKRNMEIQTQILDRLDKTVESLHDLAETMHRMVAIHDEKFKAQERTNEEYDKKFENVTVMSLQAKQAESKERFPILNMLNAFLNIKTMLYAAVIIIAFFAHKLPEVLKGVFNS